MQQRAELRGMAWNHPRALDPLEAISAAWSRERNQPVRWDARSLKDFEDQPLHELADHYDLLLIDYPFVGVAATSGLIAAVDDWAPASYLEDQARHSVGPSFDSYGWGGKQWALAVDAACQVAAVRDELLEIAPRHRVPASWTDVAALARALRGAPSRVAVPLNANHAYCAFLSIGVGEADAGFWRPGERIEQDAARAALGFLRALARDLHPCSRDDDPIGISERMSRSDEIAYVPLLFGYSSYARDGFRPHRLRFLDAPRGASGRRGSVLGGVGLALSIGGASRAGAAELACRIAGRDAQCGLYASSGGQPGHAAAWVSDAVNAQTNGFFAATRATIEQAFVRPRVPGHRRFQPLAGEVVHRCIWNQLPVDAALAELDRLADELLADWVAAPADRWHPEVAR
jgi:multiple sugar transport system substrate-binding protein